MKPKKGVSPTPFQIRQQLESVGRLANRLIDNYRQAYRDGYHRGSSSYSGSRQVGHSDPTGDVVADKESTRNQVGAAADNILEAVRLLDLADAQLSGLTEAPGQHVDHRAGELVNEDPISAAKRHVHRESRRHSLTRTNR